MENNFSIPSKTFLQRIWIYCKEMFPIHLYIPYIVALYACLNFSAQALGKEVIIIDRFAIVGMVTAFFMMLLMRTFDELKDVEIDKILFPERALPRGDVKVSDVAFLSVLSFSVLLATNLLFSWETIVYFLGMLLYAWLTFKWFFAEKLHRRNLFLTMVTHQPLPYFINFFLIKNATWAGGSPMVFSNWHVVLIFLFSLPVTAWEVSRKIRAMGMETDYETFSKIFGTVKATLIPFAALLVSGIIALFLGKELGFGQAFYILTILLMLYLVYFFTRFIILPVSENNTLKNTSMIFTTLLFLNILYHTVRTYSFTFQF